jgi:hypothetical protein
MKQPGNRNHDEVVEIDAKLQDKLSTRPRVDYSNWKVILAGIIPLVILMCCVPVFWFFLPLAVGVMVVFYQIAGGSMKKARAIAQKHLGANVSSQLKADFRPGLSSALVLNDWGVVFVKNFASPIEISWQDIKLVDEPSIANLVFHDQKVKRFETDLSQDRYFLATKSIYSTIPEKTQFLINPNKGTPNYLDQLEKEPFNWKGKWGHFTITKEGVEHKDGCIPWISIDRVDEVKFAGQDVAPYWELTFRSNISLMLSSKDFEDSKELGNSNYDLIKAIVYQKIPKKTHYNYGPSTPAERAKKEFERTYEASAAGFSIAVKTGKWEHLENLFKHNLWLLDNFSLDYVVDSKKFLKDYSELLTRTNRDKEGQKLLERANRI